MTNRVAKRPHIIIEDRREPRGERLVPAAMGKMERQGDGHLSRTLRGLEGKGIDVQTAVLHYL